MNKTFLMIAALLASLAGSVHAQATASTDPIVQMREQQRAANATFNQKRAALRAERNAQIATAAGAAAKEATANGRDPAVARRDATAKARSATQADFNAKMKVITQERNDARAAAAKTRAAATPAKS
jgi:hypothetical protein